MATEAEIRGAERARLEGIVAEHGTEREQFQLVLSGVMRSGITLAQYEGAEPVGYLPPEPELLAMLARRVERRVRLKLPAAECAGEPPTPCCSCLQTALDEPGDGGKRHVLRRATALHWSPPPRPEPVRPAEEPTPVPQEALAESQEANESVEDPLPKPKPKPKSEPPVRVVKHFPRWNDPHPDIRNMRF